MSNNISSYREAIRVYLNTTHDMFTWVDNKNNLLYCIDMNKLVRYNNMSMIMIGIIGNLLILALMVNY